jgi:hypothetical protein
VVALADQRVGSQARVDCEFLQRSREGYVDHGQLIMRGFVAIFESGARAGSSRFDAEARGSRFHAATMLTVGISEDVGQTPHSVFTNAQRN